MKNLKTLIILSLVLIVAAGSLFADDMKTINKTFKGINALDVDITSGDCIIKSGDSKTVSVEIKYNVQPSGNFKPLFIERGKTLKLSEKWSGHSTKGQVLWTITAPASVDIEFSAASGDISIENMNCTIEINTASGDIKINKCKGSFEIDAASGDVSAKNMEGDVEISTASGDIEISDSKGDFDLSAASGDIEVINLIGTFDLSVASGDIELDNCQGEFDCSAASGDVEATSVVIDDASCFSTASGDVIVILNQTSKHDLKISSASGDATVDYNGNPIIGTIEMTVSQKRGKIRAPFKHDKKEEFEKHGRTYISNTYNKSKSTPVVRIKSSSGDATLKK